MPPGLQIDAWAIYAMDSFGNDAIGKFIWERTDREKDLVLGDGATASTFPTFTDYGNGVSYYSFDGVNDYVSSWPTMPAEYTVVMANSSSYPDGQPSIQSCNDTTIEALLTTPGGFTGNVHSVLIFDSILDSNDLASCELEMLKRLWRDTYVDPFSSRFIRDRSCLLWCGYNTADTGDDDRSDYAQSITNVGSTWDDGATFAAGQYFQIGYDASMVVDEFTIHAVIGSPGGSLVKRTSHFLINVPDPNIPQWSFYSFDSPVLSKWPVLSATFTFKKNDLTKVYHDGSWVGDSLGAVPQVETVTNDLYVGNTAAGTNPWQGKIKGLVWFDHILTALEIRALHHNTISWWT